MPGGEYPTEEARKFVEAILSLFDGKYGFKVDETSYEGGEAATVKVGEKKIIRFDILMSKREGGSLSGEHYYCEAKWRADIGDLKKQFKDFLAKSRLVMDHAKRRFDDRFGFLFFANLHFGITNSELRNPDKFKELVDDSSATSTELRNLSDKITIVTLEDWLLANLTEER